MKNVNVMFELVKGNATMVLKSVCENTSMPSFQVPLCFGMHRFGKLTELIRNLAI